jgi:TonB-linked SusC/RagA family outer membrane protein
MRRKLRPLKLLCTVACLLFFIQANAQVTVKGTVTDENQAPLPGVTILEKGTQNGTVTDLDGNYALEVTENAVVVISYVGYLSEELKVKESMSYSIQMVPDIINLNDVVVIGYGVQKKSDLTGAVSSVSGNDLRKIPIATIDQALQGQAAGVNITQRSGRPGEGVDIQIRGISSINGTQPLVIIDGVQGGDLANINPSDISSIEVLKDASSAAIYGATGGNGVILVTTKMGTPGKLTANLNLYRGVENAINKIDLMNSQEWMAACEESSTSARAINDRPDTLKTYDWQDIVFKPAAVENYDLSLSGGNDVSSFLISAGYNRQEGIIRNSDYKRFTLRINSEHKILKRIKFDEKLSYVNTVKNGFEDWIWHNYYSNPVYQALLMDPSVPAYDADGKWSVSSRSVINPLIKLDMIDRTDKNNIVDGNFGLTITLIKGLDIINRFDGVLGFNDVKNYEGEYHATPTDFRDVDKLTQSMSRTISWDIQNLIQYQTSLGSFHNLSVLLGHEAFKWWTYNISGSRNGFPSTDPSMLYFIQAKDDSSLSQFITGTADVATIEAFFGRLNYDYKGKYLLTLNVRRDAASNFPEGKKWGLFPSFSLGWKFSEEKFVKGFEYLSFGKLRFGYGQTGANAKTGFPYYPKIESLAYMKYSFDNNRSTIGSAPTQIANPEITWESVNMANLGIDLGFFNNRLSLTADIFNKVNEGMIMTQEVPRFAGTMLTVDADAYPEVNIGSIRNKGYEVTITGRKNEGELTGSMSLNFSGVKNEVLDLATDSILAGRVHTLQPTSMTYVGAPVAQFYGYVNDGMFTVNDPTYVNKLGKTVIVAQPYSVSATGDTTYMQSKARDGDVRWKDLNGDGKLTAADKKTLGSPLPKLTYGFSFTLEYKGFDLSAFFNGTLGNKILNGTKQYLYYLQGYGNHAQVFADRYVPEDVVKQSSTGEDLVVLHKNINSDIPRNYTDNYNKLNSFFIEDGSYLRLRNLVLGYTIPNKITSKVSIQRCKLYAGAKNLFTLTKYEGISPDVAGKTPETAGMGVLELGVDLGIYPVTRMYYFGANITF